MKHESNEKQNKKFTKTVYNARNQSVRQTV